MTDKDRVDISLEEFLKLRDDKLALENKVSQLEKEQSFGTKIIRSIINSGGITEFQLDSIMNNYSIDVKIASYPHMDTVYPPITILLTRR